MRWISLATGALLAVSIGARAEAQSIPGQSEFGQADGWQVRRLDDLDIGRGQSCVMRKDLTPGPNPVQAIYAFARGRDEVTIRFRAPKPEAVPDRDAIRWGHVEPMTYQYAVSAGAIFEAKGSLTYDYIDANTVYINLWLDTDAAAADRIAAAESVVVGSEGQQIAEFVTGRSTAAVGLVQRCLSSFG